MAKRKIKIKPNTELTPTEAIAAHCYWCSGDDTENVRLCPSVSCPSYAYRLGYKDTSAEVKPEFSTPCKAIKGRCFDCSGFDKKEVKNCEFTDCPLYWYRCGHSMKSKEGQPAAAQTEQA